MQPTLLSSRLLLSALLLFSGCPDGVAAEKKHVLIVANAATEPYTQVISGFKGQLADQRVDATYTEQIVAQLNGDNAKLAAEMTADKPDLIFAVGGEASELASQHSKAVPIVATLILKNTLFKNANVTGVSLTYSWATQIQWLKKFFPEQKRVAVLFNPAENAKAVQELKKEAERVGLELTAIAVETPKQLPYALEQLEKNIEMLLAIPDEVTMSSKTAKEVLLASFRNRVPLIGLSDNWVKSGALYALSWDYDDLGRQCGLQAQQLLNGAAIQKVPPETPRKITYSVNSKIAEHMNIAIPESLLKNAKLTFE
jgi:putative ABC transport system substrate-binding protein